MDLRGYRNLEVWHRARALAVDVYRVTLRNELRTQWSLRDQMRAAALSVPSNIAEGSARGSNRDCVRFLWFARGSLAELATQADIAEAIGSSIPKRLRLGRSNAWSFP